MNKDLIPYNDKWQKHGYWEKYWLNGFPQYKGNYIKDKQSGYWEWYSISTSKITHKRYYII